MDRKPIAVLLVTGLSILAASCRAPAATPARGAVARAVEAALRSGSERFDNAAWGRLLAGGTRGAGVDYGFMRDQRSALEAYLGTVAGARLDRLAAGHLEALLVDAYNAFTIES